MTWPKARL